jgi:Fe-S oxidoreductase
MYNPLNIIDLIAGNVRKTRNPFGIPKPLLNPWWKDAEIDREGGALLFTGLMYQFSPYIEMSTRYLEKYEDTQWAEYIQYGKYMPKLLAGTGMALMTPGKEKRKFDALLKNIVMLLKKSEVDFYYQSRLDDYSGILLYDLGDQEAFVKHARFVVAKLVKAGVRKLITVDPHTTYALKVLYPKYTGIHFDVKTYFELVNFESKNGHQRVTLHDPCFYGRYLEMSDVPVKLLKRLNIENVAIRNSGAFTNCCGGPAESVSPSLSNEVMNRRVEELKTTGERIVAMCPICLGNLKKAGADVEDLSTLLAECAG